MLYNGHSRLSDRERYARAVEVLEQVGLSDRIAHKPNELSGGQQQRVAIARALVNNPAIILADEPTGNLDQATGAQVIETLFSMQADTGATLVLITHDRDLAGRCGRVRRVCGHCGARPAMSSTLAPSKPCARKTSRAPASTSSYLRPLRVACGAVSIGLPLNSGQA